MAIRATKNIKNVLAAFDREERIMLYHGDCGALLSELPSNSIDLIITSPPYCIGKEYEKFTNVTEFRRIHESIIPDVVRVVKPGGSICWQVGYHVKKQIVYPLDYIVFAAMGAQQGIYLRNRIVWTYGHGLHTSSRFSGRHEVVLWFTKGNKYYFDLDPVRVPQKYPGKKHYKGPKKGDWSSNPLGKNPSDVWDIPNVKAQHVEKEAHPCQYPIALAQRLIRALTPQDGVVFDPFAGTGSSGAAAVIEGRRYLAAELVAKYVGVMQKRLVKARNNTLKFRPVDRPIHRPSPNEKIAHRPSHFVTSGETYGDQG